MARFSLQEVANQVRGRLLDERHTGIVIERARGLSESDEHSIAYVEDAGACARLAATTNCAALLVPESVEHCSRPAIVVPNPKYAYAVVLGMFHPPRRPKAGIHRCADVHPSASIAPSASVGPYCVISEGAQIGEHAVLHAHCRIGARSRVGEYSELRPRVTLHDDGVIGGRCLVHAHTVVGSSEGGAVSSPAVIVEDDVEIGARSVIVAGHDRPTLVERGTKTDNLVTIGAGARIGPHCLLVSKSLIARSASLDHHVILAGQAMVNEGVRIGAISIVAARGKVIGDLPAKSRVSGDPAVPHKDELRRVANLGKLARLVPALTRLAGYAP